ncbi:MAG: NYN domain-containing protein [Candidatus Ratteibacteria bacterium]|nr:NYN domain-containing protein [Candidatus Ratteibacteria bacterium]
MSLHYILDGYNIIHQVQFAGRQLKDERERLIRFIEIFRPQGSRKNKVTVVFDGKKDIFSPPIRSEIKVVFTRNESADEWIKRFVEETIQPKQCLIVSDDKEIRFFVRALGAKVISVNEFVDKVRKKIQPAKTGEMPLSSEKAREITKELERIWLKEV